MRIIPVQTFFNKNAPKFKHFYSAVDFTLEQ